MTRTITLIIGVAVAALTIGAPVASGDPWFADRQNQADFWNYDPQTGRKIADTSPGLSPQDLAGQYSPSSEVSVPQLRRSAIDSPANRELRIEALDRQYGLGEVVGSELDAYPASTVLINRALENPVSVPGNDQPAPVSASTGREIEWPQIGIGLGIGALLMIGLYVTLKATRHRPLAH